MKSPAENLWCGRSGVLRGIDVSQGGNGLFVPPAALSVGEGDSECPRA
jgi:hypothetical protein